MAMIPLRPFLPLVLLALCLPAAETDIVFPPGSGVVDVVKDYGIDNTGKTDVTAKLNALLEEKAKSVQVLWFRKGTYLVSGMVHGKLNTSRSSKSHSNGPWVVGESRTGTVIRLKDGTWPKDGYDLASGDKRLDKYGQVVWHTSDSTNTTFNQMLRNLTINIGKDNDGAVGLVYITSNLGHLSDVDVVSEDGKGCIGIALTGSENGPGQVRHVRVRGFKRGMLNMANYFLVSTDVTLEGWSEVGLLSRTAMVVEGLTTNTAGSGPAVRSEGEKARLCLVGARLGAAGGEAAITGDGMMFLRDIQATGYARAAAGGEGSTIEERCVGDTPLGGVHAPGRSLRLPIKPVPWPAWDADPAQWASVKDFPDFKTAVSAGGKRMLAVPFGEEFPLQGEAVLGGDYARVVGTCGRIKTDFADAGTRLVVGDGSAPVVCIEGLRLAPTIVIRTSRTVILDQVVAGPGKGGGTIIVEGDGDVFLNDCCTPVEVRNPKARVWLRSFHHESPEDVGLTVHAGRAWVLGWKSENLAKKVFCGKDAWVEMLGFQTYEVGKDVAGTTPIAEVQDGQFSAALICQKGKEVYGHLVVESRGGEQRVVKKEGGSGPDSVLCAAFDPARAP